ncbi:MAG: phosphodiesterase [Clostridia bacterium]|jgi:putative phosphoesterase|nr:phosphodiesterase [Clostridia bacterium]
MKLLIASDIHGSYRYCEKMLHAFDQEKADRMLLLGDILYHGPRNDLPDQYCPKDVISALNERKEKILCVRGNCDTEVDQMVLAFPVMADYSLICIDALRMYATHGHIYHPDCLPPLQNGDILLYGHTHVPAWEKRGKNLCLNPGSVSIPKNQSPRGYIIYSDGTFNWKTLDGDVYHTLTVRPC